MENEENLLFRKTVDCLLKNYEGKNPRGLPTRATFYVSPIYGDSSLPCMMAALSHIHIRREFNAP